jgi:hypothetical protein
MLEENDQQEMMVISVSPSFWQGYCLSRRGEWEGCPCVPTATIYRCTSAEMLAVWFTQPSWTWPQPWVEQHDQRSTLLLHSRQRGTAQSSSLIAGFIPIYYLTVADLHWHNCIRSILHPYVVETDLALQLSTLGGAYATIGQFERASSLAKAQERIASRSGEASYHAKTRLYQLTCQIGLCHQQEQEQNLEQSHGIATRIQHVQAQLAHELELAIDRKDAIVIGMIHHIQEVVLKISPSVEEGESNARHEMNA